MKYIVRDDDVSVLDLSVRSSNVLHRSGLHTVGSLLDYPTEQLGNLRNLGSKSLAEIVAAIEALKCGDGEYVLADNDNNPSQSVTNPQSEYDKLTVYIDQNGVVVHDVPIELLGFNNRAFNRFKIAGINYASRLLGVTKADLLAMPNMGEGTAVQALEIINGIKVCYISADGTTAASSDTRIGLAEELFGCYGGNVGTWQKLVLSASEANPQLCGEGLVDCLYQQPTLRADAKNTILRLTEQHNDQIALPALEEKLPTHLFNTTVIADMLIELENEGLVTVDEELVRRKYLTVTEFAATLKNDKKRFVLESRLNGKTLEEIGQALAITRERVRQQLQSALQERPRLAEDKYVYVFENYSFSHKDFALAFGQPDSTYHYLCEVCLTERELKKQRGGTRKPLEDILTDECISPQMRKQAERAIYKNCVFADGRYVKRERQKLVDHFVERRCTETVSYDDFSDLYHQWLQELGIYEQDNLRLESRRYEGYLADSMYTLWQHGRCFRYYDINSHDITAFLNAIDITQYNNMEISALKLYRDYPTLMEDYDIRNEYELHNLLKKKWPKEDSRLKLGRMPNLEIGKVDREQQALEFLMRYAPITADELTARYEEEYGIKAATMRTNFLASFDKYFYNGVFTVSGKDLPEAEYTKMKGLLVDDYYSIEDLKRIYSREFPSSAPSIITPYVLKTLGFNVFTSYVISNKYTSAAEYFHHLLTAEDVIDARQFKNTMRTHVSYTGTVQELKQQRRIIEFAPHQYISIRRLNGIGITENDLTDYCNAVKARLAKGTFFTVQRLKRQGFTHKLDDLGFDDWFYSSLISEDRESFSFIRVGNVRLFFYGKMKITLDELLLDILLSCDTNKIELYDLVELLNEEYGISINRYTLVEHVQKAGLYYDSIMQTVYLDYDTYFEEV